MDDASPKMLLGGCGEDLGMGGLALDRGVPSVNSVSSQQIVPVSTAPLSFFIPLITSSIPIISLKGHADGVMHSG